MILTKDGNLEILNDLTLNSFAGLTNGLLTYNSLGLITPLVFNGSSSSVLLGDGTFGDITGFGWKISADNLYNTNTGFVGIGTSNPQSKLDVDGNTIIRGTLHVFNGIIVGTKYTGDKVDVDTVKSKKMEITEDMKIKTIFVDGNNSQITSTTNSIDFVNTNLITHGSVSANTINTNNLNVGYTSFDSLRVINKLKIGTNSLSLAGNSFTGNDEILSDAGKIVLGGSPEYDAIKIGIGTNNPQQNLHLYGVTCLGCAIPNPKSTILRIEDKTVDASGGYLGSGYWDFIVSGATKTNLYFQSGNANNPNESILTLTQDRKVGINTETVYEAFQIGDDWTFHKDGTYAISRNFKYDYNTNEDKRIHTGIASRLNFDSQGDIILQTAEINSANTVINWTTGMCVKNNGKIGIGTTNPTAKLEIVNNDDIKAFKIYANTDDYSYSMATYVQHDFVKNYVIKLNGEETFRVYGNGMVEATDVWVSDYTDFPDYVFDNNYNRMSIADLDKFVKNNKHLPEIPTAKQVSEEGVSLKDMNTLLLKKIEELTLYIIDLQKQINELKEE